MSVGTRNPLRMQGANVSGQISTNELLFTRGGLQTACVYSGAIAMGVTACPTGALSSGGSVLITSGAGRLNTFTALYPAGVALAGNGANAVISGQPIVLYDSAITARSGVLTDQTIAESGRKILYAWAPPNLVASGSVVLTPRDVFGPQRLDVPFFSGLCAMALSGAVGFVVSFTPEIVPSNP